MSRSRRLSEPAVRGYAVTHPAGRAVLPIEPGWDQLVYAEAGVMTVSTPDGAWTIPSHRALWIPDSAPATISNRSRVAVRTLYFATELRILPFELKAVDVPDLAHALVLHTVRSCPLRLDDPVQAALLIVLTEQLKQLPEEPLRLVWPRDQRALDVAHAIVDDPQLGLDPAAIRARSSRRSVERAFAAETGLSLGAWRRRALILHSLDELASGTPVARVAATAGYSTPSAYVAAFTKELGRSPRRYLRRT